MPTLDTWKHEALRGGECWGNVGECCEQTFPSVNPHHARQKGMWGNVGNVFPMLTRMRAHVILSAR